MFLVEHLLSFLRREILNQNEHEAPSLKSQGAEMYFPPDQTGADPHNSFICLLFSVKKYLFDRVASPGGISGVRKELSEVGILDVRVLDAHDFTANVCKHDHQHFIE